MQVKHRVDGLINDKIINYYNELGTCRVLLVNNFNFAIILFEKVILVYV